MFGDPAGRASWAWRFEGHHVSLTFTIAPGLRLSNNWGLDTYVSEFDRMVDERPWRTAEGRASDVAVESPLEPAAGRLPDARTTAVTSGFAMVIGLLALGLGLASAGSRKPD